MYRLTGGLFVYVCSCVGCKRVNGGNGGNGVDMMMRMAMTATFHRPGKFSRVEFFSLAAAIFDV